MPSDARDLALTQAGFTLFAAGLLAAPLPIPSGPRIAIAIVVWLVAMAVVAVRRRHSDWLYLLRFVVPLSALQVLPDWFLSRVLGVLVFPEDGFPKFGTVSAYMALLWSIPLFLSSWVGLRVMERRSMFAGALAAAATALLIFWISEETLWRVPIWHAKDVRLIGHSAIYVLPAEAWLGAQCLHELVATRCSSGAARFVGALRVTLGYLGALALCFLVAERL
jgi:hypothetical protein